MEDADHVQSSRLGSAVRSEVLGRVELVDEGRRRRVARADDLHDSAAREVPHEQPAPLEGQRTKTVRHERVERVPRELEHPRSVPSELVGPSRYAARMARAKKTIARREAAKEAARGADRTVATNRRARHEYEILETIECGIVLQGSEVKSLREGTAQIADGYARVDDGELWLFQTHIPPWRTGVGFSAHDPDRRRKLLVHRRQIDELLGRTRAQPLTLIPLRVYFSGGKVKVELAVAKGKKLYDRRQELAKRDAERDMARALRGAERLG